MQFFENRIFQQNYDTPHTAQQIMLFLTEHMLDQMAVPTKFPSRYQ